MSTTEVVLALLRSGPVHGYDVKRGHDAWFPDTKPLAFGQVYATLSRLARDGEVEVVETRVDGGPERTVYALTDAGRARLETWLAEPSPVGSSGADDIVRKAVAALRTGQNPAGFLRAQRAAHLRRMRELTAPIGAGTAGGPPATGSADEPGDAASRLARDHLVAHLDADLRWLDLAVERVAAATAGTAGLGRKAGTTGNRTTTRSQEAAR